MISLRLRPAADRQAPAGHGRRRRGGLSGAYFLVNYTTYTYTILPILYYTILPILYYTKEDFSVY